MQDYIYSTIPILAMVIHLIINFDTLPGRWGGGAEHGLHYRGFLAGIFAYCIVDAGWGLLAGLKWTKPLVDTGATWGVLTNPLYVDTMLYYIAIAVSVLMWRRYVIAYLELGKWTARSLAWFGYALLALYVGLLTANVFNGCLFHFDAQGAYHAGFIRRLIFYPLVVLNLLMAGFVLVKDRGSRGAVRI